MKLAICQFVMNCPRSERMLGSNALSMVLLESSTTSARTGEIAVGGIESAKVATFKPLAKNYYFSVFSPSTWETFISLSPPQLGFPESSSKRAKALKPGDICIAYVTSISRICGAFEIVGNARRNIGDSSIWGSAKFPVSVEVRPMIVFDLLEAPQFLTLAHTQSWFVRLRNKAYWSFAFRNPPRPVKESDAKALLAALDQLQDSIIQKN